MEDTTITPECNRTHDAIIQLLDSIIGFLAAVRGEPPPPLEISDLHVPVVFRVAGGGIRLRVHVMTESRNEHVQNRTVPYT